MKLFLAFLTATFVVSFSLSAMWQINVSLDDYYRAKKVKDARSELVVVKLKRDTINAKKINCKEDKP